MKCSAAFVYGEYEWLPRALISSLLTVFLTLWAMWILAPSYSISMEPKLTPGSAFSFFIT